MPADRGAHVQLDSAHAHFLGVGKIAPQHADVRVHDLRLEIVDLRIEHGQVGGDARREFGLDAELDVALILGCYDGGSSAGRPRASAGTPPRFSPTDLKLVAYVAYVPIVCAHSKAAVIWPDVLKSSTSAV